MIGVGCDRSSAKADKSTQNLLQVDEIKRFVGGVAPVRKGVTWAYADESGKVITKFIYEEAHAFSEGMAAVKLNDKWGFINESGVAVIEPRFESVSSLGFSESVAEACPSSKCGYVDKLGQFVIEPKFDFGLDFKDGMACVIVKEHGDRLEALIDKHGKFVVGPRYNRIDPFSEDLAGVKLKGLLGFIDRTGRLVIPIQFDEVQGFGGGLVAARRGRISKWGFVDKTGHFLIMPRFDEVATVGGEYAFSKGYAKVKTDAGWGCITKTGEGVDCPS